MAETENNSLNGKLPAISQLGDYGVKGGLGAVLGIVFMFAQDFREDQKNILDAVQKVQLAQVQGAADREALRTAIASLVRDIQANEEKIKQQWSRSRRNDLAMQLLAKELATLTKKDILLPPLDQY